MHNQLLGCLLDLMENQKTMSHVTVWRGKDNIMASHLLCELWRDEERRLGVQRDSTGAVAGTLLPQQNPVVSSLYHYIFS